MAMPPMLAGRLLALETGPSIGAWPALSAGGTFRFPNRLRFHAPGAHDRGARGCDLGALGRACIGLRGARRRSPLPLGSLYLRAPSVTRRCLHAPPRPRTRSQTAE